MSDPAEEDDAPKQTWARQVAGWVATAVGLVAFVMVVGWLRAPDLPDQAPDFALKDLDGQVVSLADYRGRTVVLNFWATWCGPCRLEAPGFASFARANPEIVVLGIAADGPASKLRAEARELGITYPVLQGDDSTLATYGISTYPTTVIVGPDGAVEHAHVGILVRPQLAWLAGTWW